MDFENVLDNSTQYCMTNGNIFHIFNHTNFETSIPNDPQMTLNTTRSPWSPGQMLPDYWCYFTLINYKKIKFLPQSDTGYAVVFVLSFFSGDTGTDKQKQKKLFNMFNHSFIM